MPNGTYGGVRGKETKIGQKIFVSRPTRYLLPASSWQQQPMCYVSSVAVFMIALHYKRALTTLKSAALVAKRSSKLSV